MQIHFGFVTECLDVTFRGYVGSTFVIKARGYTQSSPRTTLSAKWVETSGGAVVAGTLSTGVFWTPTYTSTSGNLNGNAYYRGVAIVDGYGRATSNLYH